MCRTARGSRGLFDALRHILLEVTSSLTVVEATERLTWLSAPQVVQGEVLWVRPPPVPLVTAGGLLRWWKGLLA